MKKVHVIGDVHGRFDTLINILNTVDADLYIQVGDFGYWPNLNGDIPDMPKHLFFCDGNHDDHDKLAHVVISGQLEVAKNGCSCGLNTNGLVSIKREQDGDKDYIPQMEIIGNVHQHPGLMEQE